MSNFHPLEVVGRGSETQLKVGEHLNCVSYIYLALSGLIIIISTFLLMDCTDARELYFYLC